MTFVRELSALAEVGRLDELEERIKQKLADAQEACESGEGVPLHRAQGRAAAFREILELPGEVLSSESDQTTE